jgi:hypothetical protein
MIEIMPLLAYSEAGEPLVAPLMSDAEWEELRSAKDRDPWMPQSRKRAIPQSPSGKFGFLISGLE